MERAKWEQAAITGVRRGDDGSVAGGQSSREGLAAAAQRVTTVREGWGRGREAGRG